MRFSSVGSDVIDLVNVVEQAICHSAGEETPYSKLPNFIGIGIDGTDASVDRGEWSYLFR
jgi:hypothetical protein